MAAACGVALSGARGRPAMAENPVVGSALPAAVILPQLAGGAGTVEIASDCKNLKGRPQKKRHETAIRRQMNWLLVGKRDEIELFEHHGQRLPVRCLTPGQDCP